MIKVKNLKNKLRSKLINYIVNVVLVEKSENLSWKDKLHKNFKHYSLIVLFSFTIGIVINGIVGYKMIGLILNEDHTMEYLYKDKIKPVSYAVMEKNIIARNIFNFRGGIPYEDTPEGNESYIMQNFIKAQCSSTEKLPLEIVGIIYTGNPKTNLIALKDPKIEIADVYKEGQEIIDYEGYSVYKIVSSDKAEFRRDKIKICVSLHPEDYAASGDMPILETTKSISIDASFVAQQLGPGFSTILNSARMVPQIIDGKTTGFKIFAIAKDSLFDKIKLSNGDVIKKVNGINLEDASQGFKVYEAFQDENNIVLEIERDGETTTKRVTVQ